MYFLNKKRSNRSAGAFLGTIISTIPSKQRVSRSCLIHRDLPHPGGPATK